MERKNKANKTTDFVKKTNDLQALNQEKDHDLDKVIRRAALAKGENTIDQAVR